MAGNYYQVETFPLDLLMFRCPARPVAGGRPEDGLPALYVKSDKIANYDSENFADPRYRSPS
jgi:hypothetical protein